MIKIIHDWLFGDGDKVNDDVKIVSKSGDSAGPNRGGDTFSKKEICVGPDASQLHQDVKWCAFLSYNYCAEGRGANADAAVRDLRRKYPEARNLPIRYD